MNEMNIMTPAGETVNCLVKVGTCALYDEGAVAAEDVVELFSGERAQGAVMRPLKEARKWNGEYAHPFLTTRRAGSSSR